jgi:hypothetical protein
MNELVDSLAEVLGSQARALVSFAPDPRIEAQFGRQPPITTKIADGLGMNHDGDAVALARSVLDQQEP